MFKIKDLTGNEQTVNNCLGCEVVNGTLTPFGGIIYQNENFTITQDAELPIDGFIVISSNRHIEKLTELNADERIDLMELVSKTLACLRGNKVADEYNVILEEKAGYHFHIWLMPRHKWMKDKFGKVLKNIKAIQDYALEYLRTTENLEKIESTCKLLREALHKN